MRKPAEDPDAPIRSFSSSSYLSNGACQRIIRGMSDVELLKFAQIGGDVPPDMKRRLERVLADGMCHDQPADDWYVPVRTMAQAKPRRVVA
jgi:hypothetical protein